MTNKATPIEWAAQLWSRPENAKREMDVEFAESIARALVEREYSPVWDAVGKLLCFARFHRWSVTDNDGGKYCGRCSRPRQVRGQRVNCLS